MQSTFTPRESTLLNLYNGMTEMIRSCFKRLIKYQIMEERRRGEDVENKEPLGSYT